jgi:hypothetical protein
MNLNEKETINNLINSLTNKVKSRIDNNFVNNQLIVDLEKLKEKSNTKQFTLKDLTSLLKIYRNLIVPGVMIQEIKKLEILKSFLKHKD